MHHNSLITPQWPAPAHIKAFSTTRVGGCSQGCYQGFNLALHVGDSDAVVLKNRQLLTSYAGLPSEPKWLQQIHGCDAIAAAEITGESLADASYTRSQNLVCVIMTADCLPILITNDEGTIIAAIHAGWRGLSTGVIENTLSKLKTPSESLMAWLGPAIGPQHFEVAQDVYQHFNHPPHDPAKAFVAHQQKWLADLPELASQRLAYCGVTRIYNSNECSYSHPDKYFSYRRDNGKTGRMASFIWIETIKKNNN